MSNNVKNNTGIVNSNPYPDFEQSWLMQEETTQFITLPECGHIATKSASGFVKFYDDEFPSIEAYSRKDKESKNE